MRRAVAVLVAGSCLVSSAGAPENSGPRAPASEESPKQQTRAPEVAAEPDESSYQVTLEELDRYIRYRQESDAALIGSLNSSMRVEGGEVRISIKELNEADQALREKHGLSRDGFQQLDRMVRDISEARFMRESAMAQAMLQMHEKSAAGSPEDPMAAMSKAMAALLRKQMTEGKELKAQRSQYGDVNVDTILRREKELKAIWARKDAEAARMLKSMSPPPSDAISL